MHEKYFRKWLVHGRMHTPHSTPGHKLQKPSKESGIFSHLASLILFFFNKKRSQKGGERGHGPTVPSKYATA